MKTMKTSVSLCLCVLLLIGCIADNNDAQRQDIATAAITATLPFLREGGEPAGWGSRPQTRAADIKTTFTPGDLIHLYHHQGTLAMTTPLTYDGTRWITTPVGNPVIYINTLTNTRVTAIYGTGPDIITTPPALTVFADSLTATADFSAGIAPGSTGSEAEYTVTLSFTHARALINMPAVINLSGLVVDLDPGTPVLYHITLADGTFHTLAAPTIAPAGATLNRIDFTTADGIFHTARPDATAPATTLDPGTRYIPAITLAESGIIFTFHRGGSILPWTDDSSPIQPALIYDRYIGTAAELRAFAEEFNDGTLSQTITVLQTADIDLNDGRGNWTPIDPSMSNPFRGLYNGNGYTISNLTIDATARHENTGLFGYAEKAQLVNIHLRGASVINTDNSSGSNGALAGMTSTCHISLCSSTGTVIGGNNCGGLVGRGMGGSITRSRADCTVTTDRDAGGLVGNAERRIYIAACMAGGNITGMNGTGGLARSSDAAIIYFCYSTATLGGSSGIGSLVGSRNWGTIAYCYATGNADLIGSDSNGTTISCWNKLDNPGGTPEAIVTSGGSISNSTSLLTWNGMECIPFTFTGSNSWTKQADGFPTNNYYDYTY